MDPDNALQLQDIVPAEPLLQQPGLPWEVWALVSFCSLLLGYLLLRFITRKKPPVPPNFQLANQAAYRDAMIRLKDAATMSLDDAATVTSGTLRHYLSQVCGDPSLFETHEEFLARHQALNAYPEDIRRQVSHTFSQLAQLKYDKDRYGEPSKLSRDGCALLEVLHQHCPI